MNNPYEDILPPENLKIGRTTAWVITFLFLLAIVVPPAIRTIDAYLSKDESGWIPIVEFVKALRPVATDQGITQRLRGFETKLEQSAEFAQLLRRETQAQLTHVFHEGNNRTVIGRDGWLYFRPALQALTGYGPIAEEPQSVAKDPSRAAWKPALSAITRFAEQLQERDIELVLVPVPVKPMIYPEYLTGQTTDAPVRHNDSKTFFDSIRSAGITVIDVADSLWAMKADDESAGAVFLKQDTHWRPRGMQAAVDTVAAHMKNRPWFKEMSPTEDRFHLEEATATHIGDLVEKLDLPESTSLFEPEMVTLGRVLDSETGLPVASDPQSPILVLGDSFVNIFHDPGLGFSLENDAENSLTGAGFAQHLALKLGAQLDVIAINGEASTGVREEFARRYDDDVRSKKTVVWVIAARDLFLSETPGKGLVRWDHVAFNSSLRPDEPIIATANQTFTVQGTIMMKSAIPNPRDSSYKDALYVIEVGDFDLIDGDLPADVKASDTLYVRLWAFKNRTYSKTSNLEQGKSVQLRLVPWDSKPELHTTRIEDDTLLFDPVPWWFGEMAE